MTILSTERLNIRPLTESDVDFIYALYNTAGFLRFVGDKQLHTRQDAQRYLIQHLIRLYEVPGMGLLRVSLKSDDTPIGICGLIKRDSLQDIDLGYGYLPEYEGLGYAFEAAGCLRDFAKQHMNLKRLVAITDAQNTRCIQLLARLGFQFEHIQEDLPQGGQLALYGVAL
ncbi:GNAT family N-acetyltransferase (plasmid) [Photobacterium sp. GJ3]|uniref:GNAT family N-acetyltransferase n=1 Tax=Photobacterium sp. GJ3 TaxID=2829502 RepID=UPI001B8AC46B|nr:GNAT family N-acetyltransferase [Photobacterium sp. GJ3]QUJ69911.1 GNAT family N-acetyltransferase [Photobacterium sp. GJ3]